MPTGTEMLVNSSSSSSSSDPGTKLKHGERVSFRPTESDRGRDTHLNPS